MRAHGRSDPMELAISPIPWGSRTFRSHGARDISDPMGLTDFPIPCWPKRLFAKANMLFQLWKEGGRGWFMKVSERFVL